SGGFCSAGLPVPAAWPVLVFGEVPSAVIATKRTIIPQPNVSGKAMTRTNQTGNPCCLTAFRRGGGASSTSSIGASLTSSTAEAINGTVNRAMHFGQETVLPAAASEAFSLAPQKQVM